MTLIPAIKSYLDSNNIPYSVKSDCVVPNDRVVNTVLLCNESSNLLVLVSLGRAVNFSELNTYQNSTNMEIATGLMLENYFERWGLGCFSPIASAHGERIIVDEQLANLDEIYIATDSKNEYLCFSNRSFHALHKNAVIAKCSVEINSPLYQRSDIRQRIEQLTELPPMPEMAQRIIYLNANPYAEAGELAKLIESDPSLSAQIIKYARSPFFGYRGEVNSVKDAISRVLGYDMVMNIALGIAAASPFKNQREGPLGIKAFWKHAVYSATLSQAIGKKIKSKVPMQMGLVYLAGLLHDFGILLLGYLFRDEYKILQQAVELEPKISLIEIEQRLFGAGHNEIGAWLMQAWNMPREIIVVLREHHNQNYLFTHCDYVNLVLVADSLLNRYDIGCVSNIVVTPALFARIGMNESQLLDIMDRVFEGQEFLDEMVNAIAA